MVPLIGLVLLFFMAQESDTVFATDMAEVPKYDDLVGEWAGRTSVIGPSRASRAGQLPQAARRCGCAPRSL